MSKVSVIIPTYNRAYCIERALISVLNQTFVDFEILVCDDASTDLTQSLVERYQAADTRIRWLSAPINCGPAATRNRGLENAKGEYIAFLDSDDEWLPEKLARQVAEMNCAPCSVGVCLTGAVIIKNGNTTKPVKYVPKKTWEHDTFRKFVVGRISLLTPTILIRRACLDKVGLMVSSMRRYEDLEFLNRVFQHFDLLVITEAFVIVNMVVSIDAVEDYDEVKRAFPYYQKNVELIKNQLGMMPTFIFEANCLTNVTVAAIRERLWGEAASWLLKRLRLFPMLLPGEILRVARAIYAVLLHSLRRL